MKNVWIHIAAAVVVIGMFPSVGLAAQPTRQTQEELASGTAERLLLLIEQTLGVPGEFPPTAPSDEPVGGLDDSTSVHGGGFVGWIEDQP